MSPDARTEADPATGKFRPPEVHTFKYLIPAIEKALVRATPADGKKLRVFDAGCGNGYILQWLGERGYHVAGCDMNEEQLGIARRASPDAKIETMSVYDDLAAAFGADWDVVVSTEVIEHLYDPRKFAQRVRELLRPGGLAIISTPYHSYIKWLAVAISGKMDHHHDPLWDGGHIKFWSNTLLTRLFSEYDFKDLRFQGAGRFPPLWKSVVMSAVRS